VALLRLLTAIHGGGMTHRDLTPGNILVTSQGRLKVGDWGIARTSVGGVLADLDGRAWWFTPPGFRGLPRDDTWMVGQLMAMLLSGTAEGPWTPEEVVEFGWDAGLIRVISRAIGPASKRYVDAYEMLVDLDERARQALPLRSLRKKRVCFTGTLANATRAQARRRLEQFGGDYDYEVGSGTDVLVCGHRSPQYMYGTRGKKLEMAKKYGTKVIDESQFWRLLQ
jgi:serine/threonine protein kinase